MGTGGRAKIILRSEPVIARSRKSCFHDSALCTEMYTENLYFKVAPPVEASRARETSGSLARARETDWMRLAGPNYRAWTKPCTPKTDTLYIRAF